MRIGIIDSGIDLSHKRLEGINISGGCSFLVNNKSVITNTSYEDNLGHGTGVASIIYKMNPKTEFVIVKIFDDKYVANEQSIIEALNFIYQQDVNLVNCSLGIFTNSPSEKLHNICLEFYKKNIPVIAAGGFGIEECYPGYFPEVYGVMGCQTKNLEEFRYMANKPINLLSKGDLHRVPWENGGFKLVDGSSIACAYASGIISKLIKPGIALEKLNTILTLQSNNSLRPIRKITNNDNIINIRIKPQNTETVFKKHFCKGRFDWIGRVALFPISEKEMKMSLNSQHLSKFKISKLIDFPRSFSENNVQNWHLTSSDFRNFDTLVLGYFHENYFQANLEFGRELINSTINHSKNFYCLDYSIYKNLLKLAPDNYPGTIYCPFVNKEIFDEIYNFQFRDKIITPTLSFIGTNSKQGKFTSQLFVKEKLEQKGYKVAHISTEPHGYLFGSDFCFPTGHNPTVLFEKELYPQFLRNLNKAIEYSLNPDIIISGIQSWTFPAGTVGITGQEFNSLQLLLGFQPDAVICSIFANDPVERIKKNTNAFSLISNGSVLCYSIIPYKLIHTKNKDGVFFEETIKVNDKELEECIKFYEEELKRPVINLSENSFDAIQLIERFFSK